MLRINLLPPYIYEGAKRRNAIVLWSVIVALVIGGAVFGKVQLDKKAQQIKEDTAALQPQQAEAKQTQAKADAINTEIASLKAKADFVRDALHYDVDTYPTLFNNVRDYTISRVLYSSVIPANQTITCSAYAPSLADVGHYLLAMERNPKITNVSIALNTIPAFPVSKAASNQPAGGMMGPMTGMEMPGMGGSMMGGAPLMGGMPPMGGSMMGGMPPMGGMGARMPGFGGGGQQTASTPRLPGGIGHDFTATLTLVNPVPAAPVYPPAGGGEAAGAAGGLGGMMGPMGGSGMGGMSMPMGGSGMGGMSMPMGGMMGGRARGRRAQ
ncbi:MAG: PilN domain-containing protein [Chthonomonadales bacterium]